MILSSALKGKKTASTILGGGFGSNSIANLHQTILEQKQAKMEKQHLIFKKKSEYDEDKIRSLFSSSVWTTEKVELYETLKNNGDLEKYRIKTSPYFDGKKGLKKDDLVFHWTNEEMIEVEKCANDVVYFAENYCKIRNKLGEYSLVTLYPFQKKTLETMVKDKNIILFMARQSGKTISTAMFMLWYMIFNPDKVIMVSANTGDTAKQLLAKVKEIYERMDFFLKPGIKVWNVESFQFDNKTRMLATTTTTMSGRGGTIDILYCDEFAFIPQGLQEEFWASTYPTVSNIINSKIILSSTPNGHELFHNLYDGATRGLNSFTPIRVDWWMIPGRDDEWKEQATREIGGERAFDQEYGLNFLVDADRLLTKDGQQFLETIKQPFVQKIDPRFHFLGEHMKDLIWLEKFDLEELKTGYFFISLDFAEGDKRGSDYNVMQILKLDTLSEHRYNYMTKKENIKTSDLIMLKQVGYYASNSVSLDTFTKNASRFILDVFNQEKIKVLFEANDGRYRSILNLFEQDKRFQRYIIVKTVHSETADRPKPKIGLRLNKQNRFMLFTTIKEKIQDKKFIIYDKETVDQLMNFGMTKKGVYKCSSGYDDLAMTLVNACCLFTEKNLLGFISRFIDDPINKQNKISTIFNNMEQQKLSNRLSAISMLNQ